MAPCIDILVNWTGGVLTNVVTVVVKETSYCWKFKTLVEDLNDEQEGLESIRKSMQVQVQKARNNTAVPSGDIEPQLKKAADLLKKANERLVKAKASSSCCNGVVPNFICRYVVGKKSENITNKIRQIKDDLRQRLDFAYRSSLRAMSIPDDIIPFETTTKARDEIITALKDNTKKKIGLYGMGGCGKSSMLKLVHKEAQDMQLFDKIAFVEVSDPPSIPDIQEAIANWFDLDFEAEKHKHARAARLSMAFQDDTSYLIILDNVWKMLNFDDIGIPFHKNCRVLLSTRQLEKCNLMGCQQVIYLPLLTTEDAWTLFQRHAGAIDEIKKEAEEVITKYCQGLPVAIRAVAGTLKGKPVYAMKEALTQLKDHNLWNANSEEDNPYKCLKFSFEKLEGKQEISLFLLCALFPNDSERTLETLIRSAFGLGIFQDVDSYQRARNKVPTVIDQFKDNCLLLQERGPYIKMHDMFRAVALSYVNEQTRVITGPSQNLKDLDGKHYFKETTRLYCHGTEEFPDQLNSPELEVLHMSNDIGNSSKFPPTFFKVMIKLKVLVIKNTSHWTKPTLLLPQSIEELKELRTLSLNGWTIDSMSCFGKLEMLDSIEISYCETKELPEELARMEKLKLLEVSRSRICDGNPFDLLAKCSQLEELYFVKNVIPKMAPNDQNVAKLIQQIASPQVKRYHLEVGSSADILNDGLTSKYMSINNLDISIVKKGIQDLAQKLEVLSLEKVQGDCTSITPDLIPSDGEYMNELTEFTLRDIDSIECLIGATKHQFQISVFSKLEKLKVEVMKGMKALCIDPPPPGLLNKLKELFLKQCSQLGSLGKLELLNLELLELDDCQKLAFLFTAATALKMEKLQVLKVRCCSKLKHILKDEKKENVTSKGHVFPNMKHITVKECNNLECIIPAYLAGGLSQLVSLEIENAIALAHVFGKSNYEADQNQNQHINLAVLKVFKLIGLPSILGYCPQSYVMEWPSLDKPYIERCPQLSTTSKPSGGVEATGQDLKLNTLARSETWKARFNTLATDLENEKDKLLAQIKEVEAKTIESSGDIQQRLKEAKSVIGKVKKLDGEVEAIKSCSCGISHNWLCQFIEGKRLARTTEKMKRLNKRLASTRPWQTNYENKTYSIVDSQPKAPYHSSSAEDFIFSESTKRAGDELLMALEDNNINIIGLFGMAGCGKTSLVTEVCKVVKSLRLFDDVIYVTVSPYANVKSVQATIAGWLGLLLIEETEEEKAKILHEMFEFNGKFLLVLDDIWSVLDLETIGITANENCKVILTSGLRHIFPSMGCQKEIYLSLLTKGKAWNLFERHVGEIEDRLEVIAGEIVEECQGSPAAIVAIARALKGKDATVWKDTSEELRDCTVLGFESDEEMVYRSLKFSVDKLQDQAMSLFLLCSLFPKDSKISPEMLTRFAFGLSIFENVDSYQRARDIVHEAINEMNNSCLLLQSPEGHFHMHHLVLKVALQVAKETRVTMGHQENINALKKESLMKDISRLYFYDMHEFHYQLNCPKLKILVVSNDDGYSSEFPDSFFMQMIELTVLAIIDTSVSTTPILWLPQSFERLQKLRTLCLRGWKLGDISLLGNLKMLDTIELLYCIISELPKELLDLKKLKLLEISGSKIGGSPFDVLARCSQLEELYFIENDVEQDVGSNNQKAIKLFDQIGSSKLLQKYHLEIGSSIDILKRDVTSKFISINGFDVSTANEAIKNLAQELEVFYLEKIQGDCKSIIPDMIPEIGDCMNELTEFLLHDSDNIECLIDTTNYKLDQTKSAFPKLLKLRIKSMKCLGFLCRGPPPLNLFEKLEELFIVECSHLHCIVSVGNLCLCNLKHLQLEDCPKLTSVFSYATARTMVMLEMLKVRDCNALKYIIKDEEEDVNISLGPFFPQLKQVSVKGCEHLEFIMPASFVGFLELETLEIEDAGELKYIFGIYSHEDGRSWNEIPIIIDLSVLKVLKLTDLPNITNVCAPNCHITWPHVVKACIRRCPQLIGIFDFASKVSQQDGDRIAKQELELVPKHSSEMAVQSVESVHIEDCEVEGIFQFTQPAAINKESNSLLLSSLQSLALNNLPHVRYIGEGYKQLFSLRRVKIYKCGELKCIFLLRTMTYISSLRELAVEDCSQLEQIIEDEDYDSWHTGPFGGKCKLERITVKSCPKLRSLFSVSTAKILRSITTLKIEGCERMEVLMNVGSIEAYSNNKTREEHRQAILPELSYQSLKDLPRLMHVCEGDKFRTINGVLFPESFNLSNLQRMTVKSCTRLISLFTESTAKTLTWLNTLEIEECLELEHVIKDRSNETSQGGSKDMVPSLRTLRLVKLPNLIYFHQGIRLRCDLFRVRGCPNLKQTIADMLEPEDLPKEYKNPEEESLNIDPAPEELKEGTSSLDMIVRQPLDVKDQQQVAHEKYKEASTSSNQHPSAKELVNFHGLFKIEARRALLLEEAFDENPQLRTWKLSQKNPMLCELGYNSLAKMLEFLKANVPKAIRDDSKRKEFEDLCAVLEHFGFDKDWVASIRHK